MSGIVFFATTRIEDIVTFYSDQLGCRLWLQQQDVTILRHGNMLFGFHQLESADTEGLISFFYESREEVDRVYETLKDVANRPPKANDKYGIYHFFAVDPEGRKIEFQSFNHPISQYHSGDEILVQRRSVRKFKSGPVPEKLLQLVLENSRFAPTSTNSQSYYFKIIRDRELIEKIAATRDWKSAPIGKAPLAVAICSDPSLSRRYIQDGCIAAYHFLLAAWHYGLGTCWIAAMDRDDVKEWLKTPEDHYIATITPLGFPEHPLPHAPKRKDLDWFVRE
jgi:nitroreductase